MQWLIQGDPIIKYRLLKDFLAAPEPLTEEARREIAWEGWCKMLLDLRSADGTWGGGLYGPKWISTHYTLHTLMQLGFPEGDERTRSSAEMLIDRQFYRDGGINISATRDHSETCVTAMVLSMASRFGVSDGRMHDMYQYLLNEQLADGGWNCMRHRGHNHSSFHTTISVLEALRDYAEVRTGIGNELRDVLARAHEFMLQHHLFRSDKTGKIVDARMLRFSFPSRWRYDVLRGLEYFASIGHAHDPRFCDAIQILKKKEKAGRWPVQEHHAGSDFFVLEPTGKPSRINTLRALRVLRWWNAKPDHC